jgi:MoaA/NifB/PqqE/SkfB family radical SAM enzyme
MEVLMRTMEVPGMQLPFLNLDIEPTNRCNAHCYFCRDQTPHQG